MKPQDLTTGTKIENNEHPAWGTWIVIAEDSDSCEIRGARGSKVLDKSEAHFWHIAS